MTGINPELQQRLLQAADKAREQAYAPYSQFRVGAAFLMDDGTIETGCNVENASYGVSICAERVAMTSAIAKGKRNFVAGAVTEVPCGACRQFMSEFNSSIPLVLGNDRGAITLTTLSDLLPKQFDGAGLRQKS